MSKLLAVAYLGLGLRLSVNHGLAPVVVLLGFVVLAIGAYASETLWLAALPSILVLGSMYPWTGEVVFAEYDIGLCALLGGRLVGGSNPKRGGWFRKKPEGSVTGSPSQTQLDFATLGVLWFLAALVALFAGVRGWLSLPPALPGDQLSLYTTSNSAVQQTKVLFYGIALVPLLVGVFRERSGALQNLAWTRTETGFLISAAAVTAVVLAERFVSVGLWDWDQELRSAGPCMTMHIGDQHIDAYWAIALPFMFPCRWHFSLTTVLRCVLMVVVAYAIFATMSRATIVSALVAATVLVIAQATYFNRSFQAEVQAGPRPLSRKLVYGLGSLLSLAGLVLVALILWNSGEAVPKRFASTAEGLQTRVSHWQTVLEMASQTQSRLWVGTGLGTYPLEYRKHLGRAEQPIALVNREGSDVKPMEVTLGKGDPLLITLGTSDPTWVASAGCDHDVEARSHGVEDSATATQAALMRGWLGLSFLPSETKNQSPSILQSATRFVKKEANPRLNSGLTTGLRLVAGEKIYAAQLVSPHAPLPWRVEMKLLKSSQDCGLQMTVCHQVLLQSCDCVVSTEQHAGEISDDQLQQISFALKQLPDDVARVEDAWRRVWSPTALSLFASGKPGDSVEVYDVRVTDALGKSVLRNSDFKRGSRYWFFVSDDHLVWRAKNCFLHLLVETGLLGLGVALTLCSWVLSKCLYTAFVRRSWPAYVTFTSLAGCLSIGMFGTLIDTPWILLLVIMQLAIAHGLVVSEL